MAPMKATVLGIALGLAGCATYSPLPLARHDDLAAAAPGPEPLSMDAVATLAVLNNPDLKVARAQLRIAEAQAFAAGLLPDPQVSYTADHPTDQVGTADPRYPLYNAYGLGLNLDLQTLLTHASARASADAAREQARLELLWQEWQTVAEARRLYVERSLTAERQDFLRESETVYVTQSARAQHALQAGDVAVDQASGDFASLSDVRTLRGAAERTALQADQGLHSLLGVKPQAPLGLRPVAEPAIPSQTDVEAALEHLPDARPDLKALEAGYRSEEALLHKAVLSQFPNISLGVTRARDVSNVHTTGIGVNLTLPLFDRGRGEIAVQRATREQLRTEYQARLDQAVGDTWQLWREMGELQGELAAVDGRLPRLRSTVETAHQAYLAGDFAAAAYLTLLNSYLSARAAHFDLTQSLWADSIALATELGTQVQPATTP
jgi:outer membrane protein TolC